MPYEYNPKNASDDAENQAEYAVGAVSSTPGEQPVVTEQIADDPITGKPEDDWVAGRLKDTLEEHPELFGIAEGYVLYEYYPENASDDAENQAEYAVGVVSSMPGELPAVTEQIADDLITGKPEDGQVDRRLKDTQDEHPKPIAVSAGYAPYEYDPKTGLYAGLMKRRSSSPID